MAFLQAGLNVNCHLDLILRVVIIAVLFGLCPGFHVQTSWRLETQWREGCESHKRLALRLSGSSSCLPPLRTKLLMKKLEWYARTVVLVLRLRNALPAQLKT